MSQQTTTAPVPAPAAGGKGTGGPRRGGIFRIGLLWREVMAELRKVIWPTRRELLGYTVVVLTFVVLMVLLVAGLDLAFAKGVLQLFG